VLDLVLPLECGGCGAPSTRWCAACARELAVNPDEPHLITPRLDPGVPVLSLACALRSGLERLLAWGVVDTPLTVVPAPTRWSAARRRGGDPVTRMALAATAEHRDVAVVQALRMRAFVRDSVGLSSSDRQRNVAGRVKAVKPVAGNVLVVDDIVTTGATACESVRVLHTAGACIVAVLAVANA